MISAENLKQAAALQSEVEKLQGRIANLLGDSANMSAPKRSGLTRTLSPETKARIAAAQKARWAKVKKTA